MYRVSLLALLVAEVRKCLPWQPSRRRIPVSSLPPYLHTDIGWPEDVAEPSHGRRTGTGA